jgi:uncharacterized DUF497 family protein
MHSWEDDREVYGEERINVLGFLDGDVVYLTNTERGDDMHVISLRKAKKHGIKLFAKWISR